jgi:hypothetical protein
MKNQGLKEILLPVFKFVIPLDNFFPLLYSYVVMVSLFMRL